MLHHVKDHRMRVELVDWTHTAHNRVPAKTLVKILFQ